MDTLLVVDAGTSSLRCSALGTDGTVYNTASRDYAPNFLDATRVEQDPKIWETSLLETVRESAAFCTEHGHAVCGISVTSQRASVIAVDSSGEPMRPAIMWQDRRSVAESREIAERLTLRGVYERTGLRADSYFSAPKMLWLNRNEPDIFRRSSRLIGVQDWIIWNMTGEYLTDSSQACRTMLMDIRTRRWDPELLKAAGVRPGQLPDIVEPGAASGGLCGPFARAVGLAKGTPVIISGGDQQNAALALGVLSSGTAEANTGTGSFLLAYAEEPVLDERMRVICSCGAIPGTWVLEAGLLTSGMVYSWAKDQFFRDATPREMETMSREAGESPAGSNGVLVLPHFKGAAAPHWNPLARGLFYGIGMSTTRGDIARAILEGIAVEMGENLSIMEDLLGSIREISVAGGLVRLRLFNTIQANCFNRPLRRYRNSEASTLGALMNAGVTLGIYADYQSAFHTVCPDEPEILQPEAQQVELYRRLSIRMGRVYEALKGESVEEFDER